jgi:hypothetical protein
MGKLLRSVLGNRYPDLVLYQGFFRRVRRPPPGKPALLLLNHVFDQDIEALERANHWFTFVPMDAQVLRDAGGAVFPPTVESYSVFNAPEMAERRARYRRAMDRFSDRLITLGIRAVVAPSDNFFYVRELIPSLRAKGIPYFVVDKEGTICPAYFTHFADYIRQQCPLIADHILVWSERQKQFWLRAGASTERITVTGQPRSDFWKQPERWRTRDQLGITGLRSSAPMVLFFTYDPWAYTPEYMVERGEMHWDTLRADTHAAIYTFAERHPEVDVVIKAHPQQTDRPTLEAEWRKHRLPNVHLAFGATSSNHLIVNATVVVGFQSTALIEAMLTDKPILYTFWDEAVRWANDLIPFHETAGVTTVHSPTELIEKLTLAVGTGGITSEQQKNRNTFLAEYLPNVDGHAAERTLVRIQELLSAGAPEA